MRRTTGQPGRRACGAAALLAAVWAVGVAAGEAGETGAGRGWLGVFLDDAVDGGVQLVAVVPGGPAERAGLAAGDVLVRVGDATVASVAALHAIVGRNAPGARLELVVLRDERKLVREITLGRRESAGGSVRVAPLPEPPAPPAAPPAARGLEIVGLGPGLREHYGAPPTAGVLVTRVDPRAAAWIAPLAVGDVMVALDGQPVVDPEHLARQLGQAAAAGRSVALDLVRDRRPARVVLQPTASPLPAPPSARAPRAPLADGASAAAIGREIARLKRRIAELEAQLAAAEAARAPDQP